MKLGNVFRLLALRKYSPPLSPIVSRNSEPLHVRTTTCRPNFECSSIRHWGLLIANSLGRMWMKTRRTQGAIRCVCGERKWTFNTTTVTQMLNEKQLNENVMSSTCWNGQFFVHLIDTRIMAKIKYLPSKGTTRLVGGIISTTSRKNTWRLIKIEMDNVTYITKKTKRKRGSINIYDTKRERKEEKKRPLKETKDDKWICL